MKNENKTCGENCEIVCFEWSWDRGGILGTDKEGEGRGDWAPALPGNAE